MVTVAGTNSEDIIIPTVNGAEYRGGRGNDTYIISQAIQANVTIAITDTEGANKIQLVDGLSIASSQFFANAAQLTLSNGAKIQITGASSFGYDVGANATAGDTAAAPGQTYAAFAAALGVPALPAAGIATPASGGAFTVPSNTGGSGGGAFTPVDLGAGTVAATAAAEAFIYDYQIVNGRATKAGDGEATITGFDPAKDKLVFNDVGGNTVLTEAQFSALPGVVIAENPFQSNTSIYFDPSSMLLGGVALTGIVDRALNSIVVETT
jgi:hypothetical protein